MVRQGFAPNWDVGQTHESAEKKYLPELTLRATPSAGVGALRPEVRNRAVFQFNYAYCPARRRVKVME